MLTSPTRLPPHSKGRWREISRSFVLKCVAGWMAPHPAAAAGAAAAFFRGRRRGAAGARRPASSRHAPLLPLPFISRTPTQVASHAQKHFIRLARGAAPARRRSRFSAFEATAAVSGLLPPDAPAAPLCATMTSSGSSAALGALLAAASAEGGLCGGVVATPVVRPIPRAASDVSLASLDALRRAGSPSPDRLAPATPVPAALPSEKSAFAPAAMVVD